MRKPPPFPEGEPPFVSLLKEEETPVIRKYPETDLSSMVCIKEGIRLLMQYPDPEGLLQTAIESLLKLFPREGTFPVLLQEDQTLSGEDHKISISGEKIVLSAGTREGARRAVYRLRSLTASGGYYLKITTTLHHCFLKHRISRCFFGPIKRPPHNIDELTNAIDYYPASYLDRLAAEGVNGLWLTVTFREICKNSFYSEDPQAEARRNKLRRTVEKCRRYGIKIWLFAIEPKAWLSDNPCPEPSMKSPYKTTFLVCPASPLTEKYLYECTNFLFNEIPYLGGLITISHGERQTTCLSDLNAIKDGRKNLCGNKCPLGADEILEKTLAPMERGMHDASPEAELISWLYMPYQQALDEWIYQLPNKLNDKIILAFNFESGVIKNQLGTNRCGGDYWLSAAGPSDRFGRMTAACRDHCRTAAKIQTCSSHELSTIPFIPVPGQLYKKYKAMNFLGVSAVIQCWYFGNYPGTMSRAAGELAFTDFSKVSEDDFLKDLASQELPDAPQLLVHAWRSFAKAYSNFPLDICFQYYSPVQDGPVWPLYLKQKMTSLPRTWQPDAEPAGDTISECFRNHTLEEVFILMRDAADGLTKTFEDFKKGLTDPIIPENFDLTLSLYETFVLLFESGADILEFYLKRAKLFDFPPNAVSIVNELEHIVRKEILLSKRLHTLCLQDPRLGYHSEAETYKFFPAKLQWRIECLQELLATEFAECRKALQNGIPSNEWIAKDHRKSIPGEIWHEEGSIRWKIQPEEHDYMLLTVECQGVPGAAEEMLNCHFCDRTGTKRPRWVQLDRWRKDGFIPAIPTKNFVNSWHYEDHPEKYIVYFKISRLYFSDPFYFSIRRIRFTPQETILECYPEEGRKAKPQSRLEQLFFHPEYMVSVKLDQ